MKRWDRLVDQYMEEYEAAGRAAETVKGTRRELERWGSWLKNLRPRPALEEVNAESDRPLSAWPRGVPGEGDAVRCHQQAAMHGRVPGAGRRLVEQPAAMVAWPEARRSLASAAADQSRSDAWVMGGGSDESLRLSPLGVGDAVVNILWHRDAAWGRVAVECFGLVPGRRGDLGPQQQDGPGASGAGSRDDLAVLGSVFAEIEGDAQLRAWRRGPQQEPQPSARLSRLRLAQRPRRPQRVGGFQIKDDGSRTEPESLEHGGGGAVGEVLPRIHVS